MRILLDECVPRQLKRHLDPHEVKTVREAGWSGKRNGELSGLARSEFEAIVTVDRRFGSDFSDAKAVPVVILRARKNTIKELVPLVPELMRALETIQAGQRLFVGFPEAS